MTLCPILFGDAQISSTIKNLYGESANLNLGLEKQNEGQRLKKGVGGHRLWLSTPRRSSSYKRCEVRVVVLSAVIAVFPRALLIAHGACLS